MISPDDWSGTPFEADFEPDGTSAAAVGVSSADSLSADFGSAAAFVEGCCPEPDAEPPASAAPSGTAFSACPVPPVCAAPSAFAAPPVFGVTVTPGVLPSEPLSASAAASFATSEVSAGPVSVIGSTASELPAVTVSSAFADSGVAAVEPAAGPAPGAPAPTCVVGIRWVTASAGRRASPAGLAESPGDPAPGRVIFCVGAAPPASPPGVEVPEPDGGVVAAPGSVIR